VEWRSSQYLCLVVFATACVKQLPTAPTPAPSVRPVSSARLIIEDVEAPVAVQRVKMEARPHSSSRRTTFGFYETTETLCPRTPCAVDVPPGNILLGFPVLGKDYYETELVNVGPDPSVYRRSLTIYTDNSGSTRTFGILGTAIGGTALMTGAALLPIGLAKDNSGLTVAGGASLGAGALLLTLGILAINADSPTYRPGSANHFSPNAQ